MIEAGILQDDIAIIDSERNPVNGDIVVALIDEEDVTLKRFRKNGESIALEPANINYKKEFVVHMVTFEIAEQMNISCVNFPPHISEIDEAGFTLRKSHILDTPSIAESLVALECKLHSITRLGEDRNLTLGEVINVSTNTDVLDTEKNYVNIENYKPIARLFGNMYSELSDFFELKRLNYEQWIQDKEEQ